MSSVLSSVSLQGHTQPIVTVEEFGEDGHIVTTSEDKTVKLWSLSEQRCVHTSTGYSEVVNDVSVIDDCTILVVYDYCVEISQIPDHRVLASNDTFKDALWSCEVLSDTIAVVGDCEGNLHKISWNLEFGFVEKLDKKKKAHKKGIHRIVSDGNNTFATCSDDKTAKLWYSTSLAQIDIFRGVDDSSFFLSRSRTKVRAVDYDDNYLVMGCSDKKIRIFDRESANHIESIPSHKDWVNCVRMVPYTDLIVSGDDDGALALHSLPNGECVKIYYLDMSISWVEVLDCGKLAVAGNDPYEVRIIEIEELKGYFESFSEPELEPSNLERAYLDVLAEPAILTIDFITDNIVPENVETAFDLFCGHNIILMAIRCGVLTVAEVQNFPGDQWFFKRNLYNAASKLTEETRTDLMYAVFQHAEQVRFIKDSFEYFREHDNRVDSAQQFEYIHTAIDDLNDRLSTAEARIQTNAENFQSLFDAIKKKEKYERYAGIAKAMLSLIPIVGKALGSAAFTGAGIIGNLCGEDIVSKGVSITKARIDSMRFTDLSNVQVTYWMLTEECVGMMPSEIQEDMRTALSDSGFNTVDEIRELLKDVMEESSLDSKTSSSTNRPTQESTVRHQFKAFVSGTGRTELRINEATNALNVVFKVLQFDKEMTPEEFEDVFFDISDGTMVSEDALVAMFKEVNPQNETESKAKEEELAKRYGDIFDSKNDGRSTGIKFGTRVLQEACNSVEKEGIAVSDNHITPEKLKRFDIDGDRKVSRDEFIRAALHIIHGIVRK